METASLNYLSEQGIVRLLNEDVGSTWNETDAAAALRHQLKAPLLPDLLVIRGFDAQRLEECLRNYSGPLHFGSHLNARSPSLDVLVAITHFAQQVKSEISNPLSGDAASVLYYAAAAAALRSGRYIALKSDAEMAAGLAWARRQAGAETLQTLFGEALDLLCSRAKRIG